jgi:hypothetical protein
VILCLHKEGSFVVGEYLERTSDIVDGKHISLSQKIVECHTKIVQKRSSVMAYSDNPIYEPYEVMFSSVLEIWRYACSIATQNLIKMI